MIFDLWSVISDFSLRSSILTMGLHQGCIMGASGMRRGAWSLIFDFNLRSLIFDLRFWSWLESCADASELHRGCIGGCIEIVIICIWDAGMLLQGWLWRLHGAGTARRSAAAVAKTAVGAVARTTAWAASRTVLIAARDHRHGVRVRNFRLVKARFKFEC
jgi:hypothetical protein